MLSQVQVAQEIFALFGGKPNPPVWDEQPEHIQAVFIRMAEPGNKTYHFGMDTVFAIREDGTLYTYIPMTDQLRVPHYRLMGLYRTPPETQGSKLLTEILQLEGDMKTISQRFEVKEDRQAERERLKQAIYQRWLLIKPGEVSRQVLLDLYESWIDKGPEVRLPQWMEAIAEEKRQRAAREAAYKEWLETLTPEERKAREKALAWFNEGEEGQLRYFKFFEENAHLKFEHS